MPNNVLTTAEACKVLDVYPSTLIRWINRGIATPVGRREDKRGSYVFTRDEVQRLANLRGEGRKQMPRGSAA